MVYHNIFNLTYWAINNTSALIWCALHISIPTLGSFITWSRMTLQQWESQTMKLGAKNMFSTSTASAVMQGIHLAVSANNKCQWRQKSSDIINLCHCIYAGSIHIYLHSTLILLHKDSEIGNYTQKKKTILLINRIALCKYRHIWRCFNSWKDITPCVHTEFPGQSYI